MEKFKIIGYLDSTVIATGFLIPIYQSGEKLFFHELSKNNQTLLSFTPYESKNFKHDTITIIENGAEKTIGSSSYFVFKYRNTVYFGSHDDVVFSNLMKGFKRGLSNQSIKRAIRKIFS